jgi:hypothetical protein
MTVGVSLLPHSESLMPPVKTHVSKLITSIQNGGRYEPICSRTHTHTHRFKFLTNTLVVLVALALSTRPADAQELSAPRISNQGDNVLRSFQDGKGYDLIGSYWGADRGAIYLGFYNKFNTPSTQHADKVVIGDYWNGKIPLYLTGALSFGNTDWQQTKVIDFGWSGELGSWTQLYVPTSTMNGASIRLYGSGNVAIGTTANTGSYRLAVEGKIGAREVVVTNAAGADFVFKAGYRLRPLSEVEAFIAANGRLPEMPSEADVEKNGAALGETQAKLLQKIEELTLYLIDLKKQNDTLHNRVQQLEQHTK